MRTIGIPLLLLIGAFIGVLVSPWAAHEPAVTEKRPSPFGYLDLSDSPLVCIRRGTSELLTDYDYDPSDLLSWQLHLPQDKRWNLCWAFGKFPRDGLPTAAAGMHVLTPTKPNEHPELRVRLLRKDESGWKLRFGYGGDLPGSFETWIVPAPDEQGPAIWRASNSFVTAAGEEEKTDGWITQKFTGEKPIVILRLGEANMDGFHGNDPYNGMLIWIEQASDSSNGIGR